MRITTSSWRRTGNCEMSLTNYIIPGNLTPALLRCQPRFLDGSGPLARLGRGSLQSGTTAMLFSCVTLIAALAGPKTNLYFIFMLTLGSVYSFVSSLFLYSRHDAYRFFLVLPVSYGYHFVPGSPPGKHLTRRAILWSMYFFLNLLVLDLTFFFQRETPKMYGSHLM